MPIGEPSLPNPQPRLAWAKRSVPTDTTTDVDKLRAMQVFAQVVERSSFSRAAGALRMSRSSVTDTVRNLERHLGVRLLNRTTRRVGVTREGAVYYGRCVRILRAVEESERFVSEE